MKRKAVPIAIRREVFRRDNETCVYCEWKPNPRKPEWNRLTLDHLVPACQGGDDSAENLVVACLRCNNTKQRYTVAQWIERLERNEQKEAKRRERMKRYG